MLKSLIVIDGDNMPNMPLGPFDIYPRGCQVGYNENGQLKMTAKMDLHVLNQRLFNGKRAEHPCYGCELDCDVRLVEYQDPLKRYIKTT